MCKTVVFLFWRGRLCNSRTDEIKELVCFGKEIKLFLDGFLKKH